MLCFAILSILINTLRVMVKQATEVQVVPADVDHGHQELL